MDKVKVAIVGASGYSGEELATLLLRHPGVELVCLTSRQYAGKALAEVFPRLRGTGGAEALRFVEPAAATIAGSGAAAAFLALPHGLASEFALPLLEAGLRVIDLSADFRLRDPKIYREFYGGEHPAPELLAEAVYALPEWHGPELAEARLLACPGCYPTSILIPLIPLLRAGLIDASTIVANCLSGVSGAGRKAEVPYLFVECNESLRTYGVPKHRHLSEIEQELALAAGAPVRITFVPHLVPVSRGMISTITARAKDGCGQAEAEEAWAEAYAGAPFVRLVPHLPDSKHVEGTNFVDIACREDERTGRLMIFSALDNLTKGAAGQAVQAFNMACGFAPGTALL